MGCLWDLCVAQLWERSDIGTDIHTLLCFWREGLGVWRWAGGGGMGKKNEVLLWFQGQSNHNVLPSGWMKLDSALLFFFLHLFTIPRPTRVSVSASHQCKQQITLQLQQANYGPCWDAIKVPRFLPALASCRQLTRCASCDAIRKVFSYLQVMRSSPVRGCCCCCEQCPSLTHTPLGSSPHSCRRFHPKRPLIPRFSLPRLNSAPNYISTRTLDQHDHHGDQVHPRGDAVGAPSVSGGAQFCGDPRAVHGRR